MPPLFITGTDTSVGKTFVSSLLLHYLLQAGVEAGYQKWASTGGEMPADLKSCLQEAGMAREPELQALQVPYHFTFAASPHLAAEREGKRLDPAWIIRCFEALAARYETLVVEGVGGILVPLRRDLLLIDLLARLRLLTLVVARSGLGTLNHTLLTLEALRGRNIPVLGVIFSDGVETGAVNEEVVRDNMRTVEEIGQVRVFGRLEVCRSREEAEQQFRPIGQRLREALR